MGLRKKLQYSAVVATVVQIASAQFVLEPTNFINAQGYAGVPVRYKEVPTGICELDPDVKSYSGYADVEENQHIFFWFFEARNQDPTTAPLTVWINGGPGSSSMIGLFQENGPCYVDEDGKPYSNPYSWNNASNMLYIDQPTQTGFSYSIPEPGFEDGDQLVLLPNNTCPDYASSCGTYSNPNQTLTANSTPAAAPNFYKTIQGFMGAFPQYSREEFFFTTESYGGHYGPVFSQYFQDQNALAVNGTKHINLAGVLIGNGWFDPLLQYEAYYNYIVGGNTYDYYPLNVSMREKMYNAMWGPGNCYDGIVDCNERKTNEVCSYADNFCATEVEELYDNVLGRDEYDVRELTPDPFPPEFYVDYLNTPEVQTAIGAYVNFTESSAAVGTAFGITGDDGRVLTTVTDSLKLINANITFIMYTGDADYICNWLGTEAVAEEIGAPGFSEAGYTNISTSDGVVHGQVKQSGKFSSVRIYESGHEVPFYQPVIALEMLERAIKNLDIATGKITPSSTYKTVGTAKSTYREGNGTIQFDIVPTSVIYNTTTDEPNPYNSTTKHERLGTKRGVREMMKEKRSMGRRANGRRSSKTKEKRGLAGHRRRNAKRMMAGGSIGKGMGR